jgi:hypothetical protein
MEAGTVTLELLLVMATVDPPDGAAFDSVTVQEADELEFTVEGAHDSAVRLGGATRVSVALADPFNVALIWALESVLMVPTEALNVPEDWPAATLTDPGTLTDALPLDSVTLEPPAGAALDSVTVQFDVAPELTVDGLHVSDDTLGGLTKVRVALADPFKVAVIWALESVVMFPIDALNDIVVWPAATLTDPGTLTDALPLASVTLEPPDGAALDSVTVQFEVAPESTVDGLHVSDDTLGGLTRVSVALADPFNVAVICALESVLMVPAEALNDAAVWPAATLIDPGTLTDALLLASVTLEPPDGAALDSITVQLDVAPELTVDGLQASDDTLGGGLTRVKVALADPFNVAVIWALESALISPTDALNDIVVCPAAALTEPGTLTDALPLASVTLEPPAGAALDNVTVQLDVAPELTVDGLHVSDDTLGGLTNVSVTLADPFNVAVIWALESVLILPTDALNDVVLWLEGTVTERGTITRLMLEDMATVSPPLGAGWVRLIEHDAVSPAASTAGEQVIELAAGRGLTTIVAVALVPPPEAVTAMGVELVTGPAVAVELALALLAGTKTEDGVESALLPPEMPISIPPPGAPWVSCTVHEVVPPGESVDALHDSV